MRILALGCALLLACSSDPKAEKQEECDRISDEINSTADSTGVDREDACTTTAAHLADACRRLRQCKEELQKL